MFKGIVTVSALWAAIASAGLSYGAPSVTPAPHRPLHHPMPSCSKITPVDFKALADTELPAHSDTYGIASENICSWNTGRGRILLSTTPASGAQQDRPPHTVFSGFGVSNCIAAEFVTGKPLTISGDCPLVQTIYANAKKVYY